MIYEIFGSNRIERAGLGLDVTLNLPRLILTGEHVSIIDEENHPTSPPPSARPSTAPSWPARQNIMFVVLQIDEVRSAR